MHVLRTPKRNEDVVVGLSISGVVKVWTLSGNESRSSEPIYENESKQIRCLKALNMICCKFNPRTILVICAKFWHVFDASDFSLLCTVESKLGKDGQAATSCPLTSPSYGLTADALSSISCPQSKFCPVSGPRVHVRTGIRVSMSEPLTDCNSSKLTPLTQILFPYSTRCSSLSHPNVRQPIERKSHQWVGISFPSCAVAHESDCLFR